MPKPSGILEVVPGELKEALSSDQKTEIKDSIESLNWDAPPPEKDRTEIIDETKLEADKKAEEDKKVEDDKKIADDAKAETDRLDKKAEELSKTVDEVREIEAKEAEEQVEKDAADEERIAKLADEQNKTVEEIKKEEEANKETPEQIETKRIEDIAKEEGITVDEVKEGETKDKAIIERLGGDINKVAKSLRSENSAYGKLKVEHEELSTFKKNVEIARAKFSEEQIDATLADKRDEVIKVYLKKFPDQESETDDVVFERAKVRIKEALKDKEVEATGKLKVEADTARETLIKSIPEEYKEYVPEIKEVLKGNPDSDVVDKEFDVMNLAHWARGKKFTPEHVKSLEDAAYKRGKEQPEIKKKKTGAISSDGRSEGEKLNSSLLSSATEADILRAQELNGTKAGWSKDKMVDHYMKTQKKSDNW